MCTVVPGQSYTITVERLSADVTDVKIEVIRSPDPALLLSHYRLSAGMYGVLVHILGDGSLDLPDGLS